jgi:cobalt-zinc-cadmium efflux system protein
MDHQGHTPSSSNPSKRERSSLERIRKLKIVLFLSSAYFAASILGGFLTHSLALIAEGGHMLTDVGGLALSLFAINYSRRLATPQRTYGFYRMEILAALVNSLVLMLLSAYVFYEGYRRFIEPQQQEVHSFPMAIVAAIGVVVSLISMQLLGGHSHPHTSANNGTATTRRGLDKNQRHNDDINTNQHEHEDEEESLNIRAARLETLGDALGAGGALIAGIIIMATEFYLADPIISIGLALFILARTWTLIKKSVHILMEGVPAHISYQEVQKAMLEVRGVTGVFELHIWTITSGMDALSAHVVVMDPSKAQTILKEITSMLEKRFKITHATIQIENYHPEFSGNEF